VTGPRGNHRWRALAALIAGAAFALMPTVAQAVDIALVNGWMRPAAVGQASADAYVDVRSDSALKLVAVTTPAAQRVDLVAGAMNDGAYETKVVKTFDVPAKRELRFALKGNVLRLVDIRKTLTNADAVPLRFEFKDENNRDVTATVDLQVRGLLAPRAPATAAPPVPAPAAEPAAKPMQ
jgi:copper(I)-binding protein